MDNPLFEQVKSQPEGWKGGSDYEKGATTRGDSGGGPERANRTFLSKGNSVVPHYKERSTKSAKTAETGLCQAVAQDYPLAGCYVGGEAREVSSKCGRRVGRPRKSQEESADPHPSGGKKRPSSYDRWKKERRSHVIANVRGREDVQTDPPAQTMSLKEKERKKRSRSSEIKKRMRDPVLRRTHKE